MGKRSNPDIPFKGKGLYEASSEIIKGHGICKCGKRMLTLRDAGNDINLSRENKVRLYASQKIIPKRYYRCSLCGFYHVTHDPIRYKDREYYVKEHIVSDIIDERTGEVLEYDVYVKDSKLYKSHERHKKKYGDKREEAVDVTKGNHSGVAVDDVLLKFEEENNESFRAEYDRESEVKMLEESLRHKTEKEKLLDSINGCKSHIRMLEEKCKVLEDQLEFLHGNEIKSIDIHANAIDGTSRAAYCMVQISDKAMSGNLVSGVSHYLEGSIKNNKRKIKEAEDKIRFFEGRISQLE